MLARDDVEAAVLVVVRQRHPRARRRARRRHRTSRRRSAPARRSPQAAPRISRSRYALALDAAAARLGVMLEARRGRPPPPPAAPPRSGCRRATIAVARASPALVRSECVTPAPGDHPVHRAGMDHLVGAEAVAVLELAAEEIGDGGEPDMRMRPHVDALAGQELRRPRLVEEDERPDHLPLRRRQRPAHLEAAEVAGARDDQRLDRVDRVAGRAARVERGVPAHRVILALSAASAASAKRNPATAKRNGDPNTRTHASLACCPGLHPHPKAKPVRSEAKSLPSGGRVSRQAGCSLRRSMSWPWRSWSAVLFLPVSRPVLQGSARDWSHRGCGFMLSPPRWSLPLVALSSVAAQLVGMITIRKAFNWRHVAPFLFGGAIGVPPGVAALTAFPGNAETVDRRVPGGLCDVSADQPGSDDTSVGGAAGRSTASSAWTAVSSAGSRDSRRRCR